MISMILRVFTAVGLFGTVHSLLASRVAKQRAADWFGARQRSGLYRTCGMLLKFFGCHSMPL